MAVAQKKTPVKSKTKTSTSISVPAAVNTAFLATYSGTAKLKWNKKAGGDYMATFLDSSNLKQEVEFDPKGTYLRSRSLYSKDQVPEIVTSSLSKKYPDAEVLHVTRIEVPGVAPYYKVKIKDGATGKFLLVSEGGDVSE
jgi:hypothetical protein